MQRSLLTQALVPAAVPAAAAGLDTLGDYYKRINAPFGQFASDMLVTSTKALKGADPGDTIYSSKEASITTLTNQRDALVLQIRSGLDAAAFASQALEPMLVSSWVSQAQALLTSADALAAAP